MTPKLTPKMFAQLWNTAEKELGLTRATAAPYANTKTTVDRYRKGKSMPKPGPRRLLELRMGLPTNYFEGTANVDWDAVRAKRQVLQRPLKIGSEPARRIVREALANYEKNGVYEVSTDQVWAWLKLLGEEDIRGSSEGSGGAGPKDAPGSAS